ncbi:papilin-like isoform X2 [Haemaphysalis longicornis]
MRSLLWMCALLAACASGAEYETFWGPRNPHQKCYTNLGYQPCRLAHSGQRWHFDIITKTCVKTGACAENRNNFLSKEECEYACPGYSFCLFPVKEGPCKNTTVKQQWYFDPYSHHCKKSHHCVFGENAFQRREECVSTCRAVDVCDAPRPSELCQSGQRAVWFYDPVSMTCRSDVNCHNRGNNFPSMQECLKVCVRRVVAPLTISPVCLTPPPIHGCAPVTERWVYNVHLKRCERRFACAVAGNSFKTRNDCEHSCPTEAFCYLPRPHEDPSCVHHGPLKHTWFYDRFTRECRIGVTCAHASGNTFPTRELCSDICRSRDVCTQPPLLSSSCGEKHRTVWHYSRKSRKCVKATNCHTRGNNFPSSHECHKTCDRRRNKEDCLHWPNRGPCYALSFKWYYDHYHKDCFQFLYGGCNGGPNLFDSKEECREVCIPDRIEKFEP